MKQIDWAVLRLSAALALTFLTTNPAVVDTPSQQPAPPASQFTTLGTSACTVRGLEAPVRCVQLEVPRNWQAPDGTHLVVSAAIVPAASVNAEPDPLVVLAGGPGQAASDYGSMIHTAFREIHQQRDIILFDQRGTGRSSELRCPQLNPWQYGEASVRRWARDCAATLQHTELYSLPQVIEDLEALRRALRLERINLWGVSYGTLTAQQYLRRYEQHVRSAVLDGALRPDHQLLRSAAADADAQLQSLFRECAALPACAARYPRQRQVFARLLDRLERRPAAATIRHPLSHQTTRVRLSRDAVALMIRDALYSGRTRAILPYAIDEAANGRWQTLLAMDSEMNTGAARVMAWGATLSVLCADQADTANPSASPALRRDAGFTGDSYRRFWQTACANWPHAITPASQRAPLSSRVPVLIFSGGLDPITPPTSGTAVAAQFKAVLHAIAPDAAHNVSELGCAPRLLHDFIASTSTANADVSCLRAYRRPDLFVGRRIL